MYIFDTVRQDFKHTLSAFPRQRTSDKKQIALLCEVRHSRAQGVLILLQNQIRPDTFL